MKTIVKYWTRIWERLLIEMSGLEWFFYFSRVMWLALALVIITDPVSLITMSWFGKAGMIINIVVEVMLRWGQRKRDATFYTYVAIDAITDMTRQKYHEIEHSDQSGNMPLRREVLLIEQNILLNFNDPEKNEANWRSKVKRMKHYEVNRNE